MLMKKRKGFSKVKLLLTLVVLVVLSALGAFVYFGWQSADLADVGGRKGIAIGNTYLDIQTKLRNAHKNNAEVKITEVELNQYLAKNLKMSQGGFMKDFAKVKGVYVDLKPEMMEIFIEREIAQYGDDGKAKTDVFKPFRHTVSMKLKITEGVNDAGKPATILEFPGGTIGKSPTPGLMVLAVKASFDQLAEHFKEELDLGYDQMNTIMVGDGFIKLDPRLKGAK